MKKMFFIILLYALYSICFSNPMADLTTTYPIWYIDTTISKTSAFDTIAGTGNSKLLSNFSPNKGWQYILSLAAITGTGSDSVALQVIVTARDEYGDTIRSHIIDSITSATGEYLIIPWGQSIFGYKFDLKLVGYTGNGGQVILNRLWLHRRAAFTVFKETKERDK